MNIVNKIGQVKQHTKFSRKDAKALSSNIKLFAALRLCESHSLPIQVRIISDVGISLPSDLCGIRSLRSSTKSRQHRRDAVAFRAGLNEEDW